MYALARKAGQAEEVVEEDVCLFFRLHHLLHTSHHLASPEGVYSHTGDLLSPFSLPELGFLVAKREAFEEKMGLVEGVGGLSGLGLVGGLWQATVEFLRLWGLED